MKAMVLAAGLGTRLGEPGKRTPKCLFEAGGRTLLEHVLESLQRAGVNFVLINTHHLAEKVRAFVSSHSFAGLEIELSHEPEILGTGGGLKNAERFFAGTGGFLVHNADVYCEYDLKNLVEVHQASGALASLLVKDGSGEKALLIDSSSRLVGWIGEEGEKRAAATTDELRRVDLCGVHAVSTRIFDFMREEQGSFSIIRSYMNAVQAGCVIKTVKVGDSFWIDAGTPQALEKLRARLKNR